MKALRAILFVASLLALMAAIVWLSAHTVHAQAAPRCFTLTFQYHGEELTNVESFVIEQATNVTFTTPDSLVTIVVRYCDSNSPAFLRVGANGFPGKAQSEVKP